MRKEKKRILAGSKIGNKEVGQATSSQSKMFDE